MHSRYPQIFLVYFSVPPDVELAIFELDSFSLSLQELDANLLMLSPISPSNELVTVWDPELGRQNPSENKPLKLARIVTSGVIDRELKPSSNKKKYSTFSNSLLILAIDLVFHTIETGRVSCGAFLLWRYVSNSLVCVWDTGRSNTLQRGV